jgi:hypothetical protein
MPTTRTASTAATSSKTHRSARTAGKKPVPSAPDSIAELDAGAIHKEIAQVAYRNWLERAGSAEQDWLKAEIEVRARYAR